MLKYLASVFVLGLWATVGFAQTWTGGGANGNWSSATNWSGSTLPTSSFTSALTLNGTLQTTTVQNIATNFQLNSLTMDATTTPNGFIVNPFNRSRLVFGGSTPTITFDGPGAGSGISSALRLNLDLELSSSGLTFAINNVSGTGTFYETIVTGRLLGGGASTIDRTNNFSIVPSDLVFAGAGGNFAGTFNNGTGSITYLAARDIFARGVTLNSGVGLGGINLVISGASTQAGFTMPRASSQQIGTLTGGGLVQFSDPTVIGGAARLLVGFNNTNSTFSGGLSAVAPLDGPTAHFAKVGAGVLTMSGASNAFVGGISIRGGSVVVGSSTTANLGNATATTPLNISIYNNAELRLVTGTSSTSRIQNNASLNGAGGTLRFDASGLGALATGLSEDMGPLTLSAGQTNIVIQTSAARGSRLLFTSLLQSSTGYLELNSPSLGLTTLDTAGAGNITFSTVPTLVGTTSTYGATTTNLGIVPNISATTGGSFSFVTYDTVNASLRALINTNYVGSLGVATNNVSLNTSTNLVSATTANSLRLVSGGAVDRGTNGLTITSGALLSDGGGNIVGTGLLSFGTGGASTAYITVATSTSSTITGPILATNLAKNGTGTLTLAGPVSLASSSTLAVNAGTLILGAGNTVIATNGILTYQVSGGATLNATANGLIIQANQTLTGNGTITGSVTISSTVSPSALGGPTANGAAPGTLTLGSTTWSPGGNYHWYINSVLPGPFSQSFIAGAPGATLNLSGLSDTNLFRITIDSLALSNENGPLYDFDPAQSYTWTVATYPGGVTGFAANKFTVDTSSFEYNLQPGESFSVSLIGNDVVLIFTPVPEPTTIVGISVVMLAAITHLKRRRTVTS